MKNEIKFNLFFFILILVFSHCINNTNSEMNKKNVRSDTIELLNEEIKGDSSNEIISTSQNNNISSENFVLEFLLGENKYKIEQREADEEDTIGPVVNVINRVNNSNQETEIVRIGTAYKEDLTIYSKKHNYVILENYFSTTGNKIYYIFALNGEIYFTEKLDESIEIDTINFNLENMELFGMDYKNDTIFIKLYKLNF
ncbi:MAG: hypothetical protein KatS3mg034_1170 [Vicingaceae bacterium]|nr:MAG: hypothetical protein KatS3mg027_2683 [Bacteroidia bacterium]GIV41860.1 MAG: hypothetical protein KatS3mg034_1170 [Vicingaceae bacterium]